MTFRVTFKTPDAVRDNAIDAVRSHMYGLEFESKEDEEDYKHDLVDKTIQSAKRFVKYGEYLTVEFDTEKGTATVIPV